MIGAISTIVTTTAKKLRENVLSAFYHALIRQRGNVVNLSPKAPSLRELRPQAVREFSAAVAFTPSVSFADSSLEEEAFDKLLRLECLKLTI